MYEERKYHDMGGLEAGAIDQSQHDKAPWEKRVDALTRLLGTPERRILKTDEMRRAIESLGPDAYNAFSYYERWMAATAQILLEKRVITVNELGERMAQVEARERGARQ